MSKTAEANATEAVVQDITSKTQMTLSPDIIAMIAAAVAAAVKEAKRDPKAEEAEAREEANRERVRQEEEQRIANMKARQAHCPHLDAYENYAFVGQRNCLGQYVFICSQCFRPFHPSDPDYSEFAKYVKLDKMGAARQ